MIILENPLAKLPCAVSCLALLIFVTSCAKRGEGSGGSLDAPNLLVNPGFEEGSRGWSRHESELWGDFQITASPTRSGQGALRLDLSSVEHRSPTMVFGAYQELTARPFPERVSGSYRVEHWQNEVEGAALYLQVVVVVFGDPRTPEILSPENPRPSTNNYQIRYYLAGAPERVITISNAKVEVVSGDPPRQQQWVHFDLPIRRDFERLWGVVPSDYDSVRFLFEARWDRLRRDAEPALRATVYYDDLSVFADDDATKR